MEAKKMLGHDRVANPRYLVTGDPVRKMQPVYDTSLVLMHELLKRNIEVDYCDLFAQNTEQSPVDYLKNLHVTRVLHADPAEANFIALGPKEIRQVDDYAVILQRKDPPVDDFYRAHAAHFVHAPARIVQINHPAVTPLHSEHELPTMFPEFSIPTAICKNFAEFVAAVRREPQEAVAKPFNECSGKGISFFKPNVDEKELREYWQAWQPTVIVQPFIDEITKSGDLRILVLNGRVLGSVLRVPRAGSRLANLHQGATGRAWTPTARQLECCAVVSAALNPAGLYLLGLDFIGDLLSEVNITSPSAVSQINEVSGTHIEREIIDEIEKLRLRKHVL